MNLLTRTPEWLRGFLGLQEPEIPNQLRVSEGVLPVVDIARCGLTAGESRLIEVQLPVGTAPGIYTLSSGAQPINGAPQAADLQYQTLVWMDIIGGAGLVSVSLTVRRSFTVNTNGGQIIHRQNLDGGAANRITHKEIFGTGAPVLVPPGGFLAVGRDAALAGGDMQIRYETLRFSASVIVPPLP